MITAIAPKHILVVDDNPGTLYATSRVLRSAGFTVTEAATGREGLAASISADLVVLDINLPDIDGYEVCRGIRANINTARTPVIHLSATFVQEQDKVRGLNDGADGYLTHPVEPPVLIATVNAFLRARQAEDAMRESEAKFRAIFDQVPHGIALVSQDFIYLEVNPGMCQILGRTRDQIVGKHNSAFMPVGQEGDVIAVAEELERGGIWRGDSTLLRSDATHVQLTWTISAFSIPGVRLAIASDITARRAIEAERERLLLSERSARTEAERANRLKDDFLATLSHELRTPLNAIVGWLEVLRRNDPSPEDMAEGLETIERNVKAQSQLISDLLDVSRITSGKLRLELQQIDPNTIINSSLDSVISAANAKGIKLRRNMAKGRKITADPNRLQQIVWNLVTNAVKFTPTGGEVEVKIEYTSNVMLLAVTDNGQGISAEFLPHIFERFSQADASSRRIHGGLGIGLAIVKNLVEMHGGTIQASSEGLTKGARFTMSIPLVAQQSAVESSPSQASVPAQDNTKLSLAELSLHGIRVLIVDDDLDARNVLVRLLGDFDATVLASDSVAETLNIIRAFEPHVLVSDIGMPGQDGYDLIHALRKLEGVYRELPAIALTAFAGRENASRALSEGFQVHLAKPVNPTLLVSEIMKLVSR
ncbi:MAG TPA: response regulator, partial [Phycisphaerae bacterium]